MSPLFCVQFMDNFVCKFDTFALFILQYYFVKQIKNNTKQYLQYRNKRKKLAKNKENCPKT